MGPECTIHHVSMSRTRYYGASQWFCPICENDAALARVSSEEPERPVRSESAAANNAARAAKSAADMALYQPYNAINNEEHLK